MRAYGAHGQIEQHDPGKCLAFSKPSKIDGGTMSGAGR